MTKATDRLHLTQSALSHQLREAEIHLGTKIFHRQGKEMRLTPAGSLLYKTANQVLQELKDAESNVKRITGRQYGEIRVGGECYISHHWFPTVLKSFYQAFPGVELQLIVGATHNPVNKLLAGELDLAIVTNPTRDHRISFMPLLEDEIMLVAHANHRWSKKDFVPAEELREEHLIIHSHPLESIAFVRDFLTPAGISPMKISAMPLLDTAINLVRAEVGVIAIAQWCLQPYLKEGNVSVVRPGKNGIKRKYFLAVNTQSSQAEYLIFFASLIQKELSLLSEPNG